jgi:hypothetical protein
MIAGALRLATELDRVVQIHNDSADDMARLCASYPRTTFELAHLGDSPDEVEERIGLAERFSSLSMDISGHGYRRMGYWNWLFVRQGATVCCMVVIIQSMIRQALLPVSRLQISMQRPRLNYWAAI